MTTGPADTAPSPSTGAPARPRHSRDRRWWFDGREWVAAVSPDGRHWFDGRAWVRNRPRAALPVTLAGLLALLAATVAVAAVLAQMLSADDEQAAWVGPVEAAILPLFGAGLLVLVTGLLLMRRRVVGPPDPGDRPR